MRLFNAWVLAAPLIAVGAYLAVFRRDTARRMGVLTGYTSAEKTVAIAASLCPHVFTLLTIFIPLSSSRLAVAVGAPLYLAGVLGFLGAVASYDKAPSDALAVHGVYRISRNPMYVAALLSYAGIAVMTMNLLLTVLQFVMIILHHWMILAEERACAKRFGMRYEQYKAKTPRYLFL